MINYKFAIFEQEYSGKVNYELKDFNDMRICICIMNELHAVMSDIGFNLYCDKWSITSTTPHSDNYRPLWQRSIVVSDIGDIEFDWWED